MFPRDKKGIIVLRLHVRITERESPIFGINKSEKLRKNFDKNGINTVGEVTQIGDTLRNQFFAAQFGDKWEEKPPAITVKFRTLQGKKAFIQCRIADRTYKVGKKVNVRYIKTENGYCGYILC